MKDNRTLVLINSPLQALCALEYVERFNIQEVDYYVVANSDRDFIPIEKLLRKKNIVPRKYKISSIFQCLRMIPKYKPFYNRVIMGEYFGINMRIIAFLFGKKRIQWVYLDDGSSTLEIKKGFKSNMSLHHRFLFNAVLYIQRFWHVDELFFSAFLTKDVYPELEIIENDFAYSFGNKEMRSKRWIVVIGCYVNEFKRVGKDYYDYLNQAAHYIKHNYPKDNVSYFPHRYEDDLDNITLFCEKNDWMLCFPDINIEIEIIEGGIKPEAIIGFGSSALFTLKKILKDVPVATYSYIDGELWDEYEKNNIQVLN